MNKTYILCTALAALPCAAAAQSTPSVSAALSFSTSAINSDSADTRQTAFNFVSDIAFSDAISLGFDADYGRVTAGGSDVNFDLTRLQLEPTYHFGNGAYVGAYVQRATTAISIISISLDSTGAFAGYDAGTWAVDGYIGNTVPDTNMGGNAVPSLRNTGATVTLRPAENLELFAHAAQSNGGAGSENFIDDVKLLSLGGQYNLNNGITVYAATQRMEVSNSGMPLRQTALGAGFELARLNANMPGTVTLEVARNSAEGTGDSMVTTIGWIMPIGKAKAAPLSGIARTARGGIRGAFVAGAGSMSLLSSMNTPL